MSLISNRKLYGQLVLWSSQILFSLLPAYADDRSAANAAKEYVQCLQTNRSAGNSATTSGFLIREGLQPYSFSVWSAADGDPIAQVSVERPGDERFDEASASSKTLMEEVAKLKDVPTARRELGEGINIISVNSSSPGAAFAGMSVLTDSRRNEMCNGTGSRRGATRPVTSRFCKRRCGGS
jgi:hypothetical protein